ncbi:VWA domain-containing protein [Bacillaceae bacterium S4-13-58]
MGLQFDEPLWLLSILPLAFLLLWFYHTVKHIPNKWIILTLRTLILLSIIFALAGLSLVTSKDYKEIVFVADRSHSTYGNETLMKDTIQEAIQNKGEEDKYSIVSLGREAVSEIPMTNRNHWEDFQTEINREHTNLTAGLRLASGLFQNDQKGRTVLLTDGNETMGDVIEEAGFLKQQGFIVDVFPIETKGKSDVAIESFQAPTTMYLGEKASLTGKISSNINTNARLRMYEDDQLIMDQQVELVQGTTEFSYPHIVQNTGFHSFRAEIISDDDEQQENNELYAYTRTKGNPLVLVVEGEPGNANNLVTALQSSDMNIKTVSPELLPTSLGGFLSYDSIVMSNVSATDFDVSQMELMKQAVEEFGIGFVMSGGENSYGLGGYYKTPIEEILPVEMELKGKNEIPSTGIVMIIDKSGSMSGAPISLAIEAAARSLDLLRENDTLGVIAFDNTPWQIVETGPIEDKKEMEKKIRSITANGGTDIFTPLEQGYEQLGPLNLKKKHIILLTDGQSATSIDYRSMIESYLEDEKVSLSTIAIGSGADTRLLEEMAELGGGRYYHATSEANIPVIFSRETALVTRTYIVEEPFVPTVITPNPWEGLFSGGVPTLNAYVATTPKGRGQRILMSHEDDPVLMRWQYGLGRTVAWTSDLSGWSGQWPQWSNWSPLWNEILSWTFPQYEQDQYEVEKQIEGDKVILTITSSDPLVTDLEGTLVTDQGQSKDFTLDLKGPGVFEGKFTAEEAGIYYLQLSEKKGEEIVGSFQTRISVPYSNEFAFQGTNNEKLEAIAQAGGGEVLEDLDFVFSKPMENPKESQPIFHWLLSFAALLFLVDVFVRRFDVRFNFNRVVSSVKDRIERPKEPSPRTKHLGELTKSVKEKERKAVIPQVKRESLSRKKEASEKEKNPQPKINTSKKTIQEKSLPLKERKNPSKNTASASNRTERMNQLLDAKKRRNK